MAQQHHRLPGSELLACESAPQGRLDTNQLEQPVAYGLALDSATRLVRQVPDETCACRGFHAPKGLHAVCQITKVYPGQRILLVGAGLRIPDSHQSLGIRER